MKYMNLELLKVNPCLVYVISSIFSSPHSSNPTCMTSLCIIFELFLRRRKLLLSYFCWQHGSTLSFLGSMATHEASKFLGLLWKVWSKIWEVDWRAARYHHNAAWAAPFGVDSYPRSDTTRKENLMNLSLFLKLSYVCIEYSGSCWFLVKLRLANGRRWI